MLHFLLYYLEVGTLYYILLRIIDNRGYWEAVEKHTTIFSTRVMHFIFLVVTLVAWPILLYGNIKNYLLFQAARKMIKKITGKTPEQILKEDEELTKQKQEQITEKE